MCGKYVVYVRCVYGVYEMFIMCVGEILLMYTTLALNFCNLPASVNRLLKGICQHTWIICVFIRTFQFRFLNFSHWFIYLCIAYTHKHLPPCTCEHKLSRSWLFPSTMWVRSREEIQVVRLGKKYCLYLLSHHTGPSPSYWYPQKTRTQSFPPWFCFVFWFCFLHSMHKRWSALQVHKDSRSHPAIQTHCIGTPPCYTPARYAPFSEEKASGLQGKVIVGCDWSHLVSSDWHINPGPNKVPRKYHW